MEKKILIVDDNDFLRELLTTVLRSHGYRVQASHDGFSGLRALDKTPYDLLITDNQMPGMSGIELIEEICSRDMNIKIILISGDLTKEVLERVEEKGVIICLTKPFPLNLMMETVGRVLEVEEVSKRSYTCDHSQRLESAGL